MFLLHTECSWLPPSCLYKFPGVTRPKERATATLTVDKLVKHIRSLEMIWWIKWEQNAHKFNAF